MISADEITSRSLQLQAAEWNKLFPPNVTEYVNSVKFMKQLTVVAVSMISFFKGIFPEDSFQNETLGGVELKILRAKCRDESAQFISNALTQSFEALEKKYLDKLVLCLYDDTDDILVEAHSFEFTYSSIGAGVRMDMRSAARGESATLSAGVTPSAGVTHSSAVETRASRAAYAIRNIREHTLNLLRNCKTVSRLSRSQVLASYDISLRLYYNDDAPAGYQAPSFSAECGAAGENAVLAALADAACELGSVGTPHHSLVSRSYARGLASSLDANASPNDPVMTQDDDDDYFREPEPPRNHRVARSSAPAVGYLRRVRFQD